MSIFPSRCRKRAFQFGVRWEIKRVLNCRIGCSPTVGECDGTYNHESRKNLLIWSLPFIDASNKSGSLEFNAPRAIPGDFFPLQVTFTAQTPYANIKVLFNIVFIYRVNHPNRSLESSIHRNLIGLKKLTCKLYPLILFCLG